MKKLGVLMALVVVLAATTPVFAATLTDTNPTGTMTVTYGVAGSYTISIPESLGFSTNLTQTANVSVSNVLLAAGKTLKVNINSTNDYNLVYESSKIAYTVAKEGATFSSTITEVASVAAGNPDTTTTVELTFATTAEAIAAATLSGTHTDTLTFTASVN